MGRQLAVERVTGQRMQRMVNDGVVGPGSAWSSDKVNGLVERRNILHNWDFRNPVNQRGLLEYVVPGYTVDRWMMVNTGYAVGMEDGFVSVSKTGAASGEVAFRQIIERPGLYAGKTYTASIRYRTSSEGEFYLAISLVGIRPVWLPASPEWTTVSMEVSFPPGDPRLFLFSACITHPSPAGSHIDVQAAKLELGAVSTLLNDPPADFGMELLKCQRYYEIGSVVNQIDNTGRIMLTVPFKATKRINPVVKTQGERSSGTGNNAVYHVGGRGDFNNGTIQANTQNFRIIMPESGGDHTHQFTWFAGANL